MKSAIKLAYARYADYARTHSAAQFADYTSAAGPWITGGANTWVAGFTPGVMWALNDSSAFESNPTRAWTTRAGQWARRLMLGAPAAEDVGFRMLSGLEPWVAQLQTTGRHADANSVAARMVQEAQQKLYTRWNETVGAFQTTWRRSSNPQADYGVLIDQTYDLALLQWLAGRVAGDDPAQSSLIRDRVYRHAQRVADHIVRADGSSFHWGYFNSASGQFVQGETFQGYSNQSTWSRGQAWGILGFAEIARRAAGSGGAADARLVTLGRATAQRLADFFVGNLPADSVPYWDFNDPAIPDAPRDSSAAAIAAHGLLTLSAVPGLTALDAANYRAAAERILGSLATNYLSAGRAEASLLIHGAGNVPAGGGVDRGLVYGDYFFLRAANGWLASPAPASGATRATDGDSTVSNGQEQHQLGKSIRWANRFARFPHASKIGSLWGKLELGGARPVDHPVAKLMKRLLLQS